MIIANLGLFSKEINDCHVRAKLDIKVFRTKRSQGTMRQRHKMRRARERKRLREKKKEREREKQKRKK